MFFSECCASTKLEINEIKQIVLFCFVVDVCLFFYLNEGCVGMGGDGGGGPQFKPVHFSSDVQPKSHQ